MKLETWASLAAVLAGLAVVGCGGSTNNSDGAGGGAAGGTGGSGPFRCLGATLPTTAPATINLFGTVTTTSNGTTFTPVANATVSALSSSVVLGTAVTSATGTFGFSVPTGGAPLGTTGDSYLKVLAAGYVDTYVYTAVPTAADAPNLPPRVLSSSTLGLLALVGGVTQPAGSALLAVHVSDCDGNSVAGATFTISPPGTIRYLAGGIPSATATSTDASGQAFVFAVPTGSITVGASAGGHTLRSHTLVGRPDALTETEVVP